ncbi:MAG: hypothetical protein ACK4SY_07080 [Pyrobaculum sp.]
MTAERLPSATPPVDLRLKLFEEAGALFKSVLYDMKLPRMLRIARSQQLQMLASLLADLNITVDKYMLLPFLEAFNVVGLDVSRFVGMKAGEIFEIQTHMDPEIDAVFKAVVAYGAIVKAAAKGRIYKEIGV